MNSEKLDNFYRRLGNLMGEFFILITNILMFPLNVIIFTIKLIKENK